MFDLNIGSLITGSLINVCVIFAVFNFYKVFYNLEINTSVNIEQIVLFSRFRVPRLEWIVLSGKWKILILMEKNQVLDTLLPGEA